MSETLVIHVNRAKPHSIEAPSSFETSGDFDLEVRNGGEAAHVHVNLDDDLATSVTIDAGNHYLERGTDQSIPATVHGATRPIRGKLKVSTGFGSETKYIDVHIGSSDPGENKRRVTVDDRLGKPRSRRDRGILIELLEGGLGTVAIVLLAIIAFLLGVFVLWSIGSAAVAFGVLVIIGGIGTAAYILSTHSS